MSWKDEIKKDNSQLKQYILEHLDKDIQYFTRVMQSNEKMNPEHLKLRMEFHKKNAEKIQ